MNTLKILFLVFIVGIVSCKCNKKTANQTATQSKMEKNSKTDKIPFKVLFDNDHCNIKEAKNVVITNKEELQNIYARINMTRRPGVPLPKIDFDKETVLGIFLGEKSTAGYQVKVDSIVKSNKELQVYYKDLWIK